MQFASKDSYVACVDSFDEDARKQLEILKAFLGTTKHFFGNFVSLFRKVDDPRNPNQVKYPLGALLFTGVFMFLCRLGSRRQINYQFRGSNRSRDKFKALFDVEDIPHGDTLNYGFMQLNPDEVQETICRMVETLIRKKVLYPWRLLGQYFMIAIDGTGMLTFSERHCPHCLTQKLKDGTILYYHNVLEAKLVTENGFAFSLMSEFIENTDPNARKQDCELKAFYRLVERLKGRFPRLSICLLMDGLFAGGPTFDLCKQYRWKYIVVLKDKDLPTVNEEFEALWKLESKNHTSLDLGKDKKIHQDYRWVNDIPYVDSLNTEHILCVLECLETNGKKEMTTTTFKWITNFHLTPKKVIPLANKGGRLRWKIENEGFNIQKNGGFELEHAYSKDEIASKVFYFLLQIAYIIFQLLEKGSLFRKAFPKGVGSLKNIASFLLEAWRNLSLHLEAFWNLFNGKFRIRFDSS